MTTPSLTINPAIQTNFAGTFFAQSEGYTQGDVLDDPNHQWNLRKGIVSPSATVAMWGGLAISESLTSNAIGGVGVTTPQNDLQSILIPASTITAGSAGQLTGFTVMNQATAMLVSAQSRAPQAPAGGAISFYRLGSGARVPLQASSAAATAWAGSLITPQTIYWDTAALQLVNASSGNTIGPLTTLIVDSVSLGNSRTVSYNGTTGFTNWVENGYVVVVRI